MEDEYRPAVLVVEDCRSIRNLVRRRLELQGYRVFEAGTGKEALRAVREFRPDMMILDLQMPVMNGWEVLYRLGEEGIHGLPVIVFSNASEKHMTRSRNVRHWIEKSGGLERLLDAVDVTVPSPTTRALYGKDYQLVREEG